MTQASLCGRSADTPAPIGVPYSCLGLQDICHAGRVVARGVVDVDYELIPQGKLPPHFSAVPVKSLCDDSSDIPC